MPTAPQGSSPLKVISRSCSARSLQVAISRFAKGGPVEGFAEGIQGAQRGLIVGQIAAPVGAIPVPLAGDGRGQPGGDPVSANVQHGGEELLVRTPRRHQKLKPTADLAENPVGSAFHR